MGMREDYQAYKAWPGNYKLYFWVKIVTIVCCVVMFIVKQYIIIAFILTWFVLMDLWAIYRTWKLKSERRRRMKV